MNADARERSACRAKPAHGAFTALGGLLSKATKPYLSHIPKSQIVEAIKEVEPGQPTDAAVTLKKDALIGLAAEKLAGKRWLPPPLRQPG